MRLDGTTVVFVSKSHGLVLLLELDLSWHALTFLITASVEPSVSYA
jgi:hypothetical protein